MKAKQLDSKIIVTRALTVTQASKNLKLLIILQANALPKPNTTARYKLAKSIIY